MDLRIPESLRLEHEELHAELASLVKAGGKTSEAARAVADLLHPHFENEEKHALPPLGALDALARGRDVVGRAAVLQKTDWVKENLERMLAEHKMIVGALDTLIEAAEEEAKPEAVRFAEGLRLHARMEEEILYPAAIVLGEYLKLRR